MCTGATVAIAFWHIRGAAAAGFLQPPSNLIKGTGGGERLRTDELRRSIVRVVKRHGPTSRRCATSPQGQPFHSPPHTTHTVSSKGGELLELLCVHPPRLHSVLVHKTPGVFYTIHRLRSYVYVTSFDTSKMRAARAYLV